MHVMQEILEEDVRVFTVARYTSSFRFVPTKGTSGLLVVLSRRTASAFSPIHFLGIGCLAGVRCCWDAGRRTGEHKIGSVQSHFS
ncbi:hypothetical protein FOZ62_008678 [Perkinsus olseni]|uniref:Uncharacterized protein n=1 Tax=Perkinsus olseni TaxID=32597 RepID=A0A7J6QFY1_PEROL|nr:hypothetical protein FOZ62_008678 [Perkinsus olseni]